MPIKILSPQVAKQIAAGELVERPASVVKEIIENSLDAGASYINIFIEKGGIKLIRIRDNGYGITKSELALALARHATSKISSLDDLNAIVSLGFRGEALASISAVSRLTLTSRTIDQNQAWQAYVEGHTMKLTIKPAAHPIGTSLEVLDLFYNTPARRKFMCTEKTEFMHIDTVIRRIALARFDVKISLVHNSKLIRQYNSVVQEKERERRLAAICGKDFIHQSIRIDWKNDNLSLHGWIATGKNRSYKSTNVQYCYVNGRIILDKLINHAICHAYQIVLGSVQPLAYVLYLEIDPHQVDVNVHPAKRKVRFYQSRLVHDFISQGIMNILQTKSIIGTNTNTQHVKNLSPSQLLVNNYKVIANHDDAHQFTSHNSNNAITCSNKKLDKQKKILGYGAQNNKLNCIAASVSSIRTQLKTETPVFSYVCNFGSLLSVIRKRYALLIIDDILQLLSISVAVRCLKELQLTSGKKKLKLYPLLIPIRLQVTEQEVLIIDKQAELLSLIGINLQQEGHYVILRELPVPLRTQNLQSLIPELLDYLIQHQEVSLTSLVKWLVYRDSLEQVCWNYEQVVTLLIELEKLYPQLLKSPPSNLMRIIELDNFIKSLNDNAS